VFYLSNLLKNKHDNNDNSLFLRFIFKGVDQVTVFFVFQKKTTPVNMMYLYEHKKTRIYVIKVTFTVLVLFLCWQKNCVCLHYVITAFHNLFIAVVNSDQISNVEQNIPT